MSALRSTTKFRIPREETPDATARRLASETGMIADARASAAAGRTCSLEAVTKWVDSWDTDQELPPPHSGC
jgi:predicted transcriptional regulator